MKRILYVLALLSTASICRASAVDFSDWGSGGGTGAATSIVTGNGVSGGAANQVLFEDANQNLASTSTLTISTQTGVLTVTTITASGNPVVISTGLTVTGVIGASAATNQLGYAFNGSTATGMGYFGTNGLQFQTNGVVQATFTAQGVQFSSAVYTNAYNSNGDACGQGHMAFTVQGSTSTGITIDPVNGAIYFCSQDNITGILYNQNPGANPNFTVGSGIDGSAGNLLFSLNATNNGFFAGGSGAAINVVTGGTNSSRFTTTGLKIGAAANPTQTLDVTGNASFTTGIVGVTNNSLAAAGAVGEDLSVSSTAFVNAASSGTWTNVASKAFAAGDYNISGCITGKLNGATASDFEVAISSFSGNTTTDHVEGQNWIEGGVPVGTLRQSACVPPYHIHLASGTVTMYLKALWAFTAGTPQAIGTMAATRQR